MYPDTVMELRVNQKEAGLWKDHRGKREVGKYVEIFVLIKTLKSFQLVLK